MLVVEDSPQDLLLYERTSRDSDFQGVVARTLADARRMLERVRPPRSCSTSGWHGDDTWGFIWPTSARAPPARELPVVVVTSIDDQAKGLALGADAYALKPVSRSWLLETLARLVELRRAPRLLVIDDDEISRYLVRARLGDAPLTVQEAPDGPAGLRAARAQRPSAIVLDLSMPE